MSSKKKYNQGYDFWQKFYKTIANETEEYKRQIQRASLTYLQWFCENVIKKFTETRSQVIIVLYTGVIKDNWRKIDRN